MRILIVKLSSIGDVVHTLPAAALLRRAMPKAHISWVVERRASEILKGSAAIDELIEIDTRAWRKSALSRETLADIRTKLGRVRSGMSTNGASATAIDVAIDFQGLIKSGVVALATGAARRVGFETAELREKASRVFLNEQVATSHARHVVDKNIALARSIIAGDRTAEPRYEFPIHVSPEDEEYAERVLARVGGAFAIINPGGGWPTKLWSADRYGELADWLWTDRKMKSIVTFGPGEEPLAEAVARASRTGAAHPEPSTLKQYVALARRASLFVGGDTGPLHLAAASRTPIVGLYGPTSPERNGPFDDRDITVGRDLWCRADCHRRSCWHWECMEIPVGEVIEAVSKRLSES
ncbi:MAG TPA: glycosyltransferase family 9 protein [Blastocatellia bacterium]|nr:glycosyltransferase family 9 protein [Blastocatellia bacterium]